MTSSGSRFMAGLVLALSVAGCKQAVQPIADLVLTNAKIYTSDKDQPWAQAVAIKDGRFIYVGTNEGTEQFVAESTKQTDIGGKLVLPGLIDGHTHPGYTGVEQFGERLTATAHDDLMAAVKARSESQPGDDWLRLCCWLPTNYVSGRMGPHKSDLDAVVPDRPVWIHSRSWHDYWLNSAALQALGLDESTKDPAPGVAVYDRDEQGQLTGWVKEGAGWQHFSGLFKADRELHRQSMRAYLQSLSEHGVTTVYDGGNFGYEEEVYSFLAELDSKGELPVRYEGTYQIFLPEHRNMAIAEMRRLQQAYGGDRLQFRTIKIFMDGIYTNRTGAMLRPYEDIPDYVGQTLLTTEELRDFLLELHREKLDLHVHAVGDLAVRRVLDAVQAAKALVDGKFYPRVTAAHLHIVSDADLPRFAELGVSANFTPRWHRMDPTGTPNPVLGAERTARLFRNIDLLNAGANVTYSSDNWSLSALSPFLGIQIGHARLAPREWRKELGQAVPEHDEIGPDSPSLEQMIEGYTINGAYPFRMEDQIGSIEAGKIADLLVMDENLFELDTDSIHQQKPSVVIMEGRILHGALTD